MANHVQVARDAWEAGFGRVVEDLNTVLPDGAKIDAKRSTATVSLPAARDLKAAHDRLKAALGAMGAPGCDLPGKGWWRLGLYLWIRPGDDACYRLRETLALYRRHDQGAKWWRGNVAGPVEEHADEMRAWFDVLEVEAPEVEIWSKADTPEQWGKVFGISGRTFKRRVKDDTIRARQFKSNRLYQVRLDYLPPRR